MAKRGKKMSILTFKGGVHPYDGKELSKDVAVRKILPEGELVFPVSQHIGAPAKPVVEVEREFLRDSLLPVQMDLYQLTFIHLFQVLLRKSKND